MLYEWTHHRRLHAASAALERQALEEWNKDHGRGLDLGDALAIGAAAVFTTIERKPGGNVSVTVCVHGRMAIPDEHYFFSLQKTEKGWAVKEPKSRPQLQR